MNNQNEGSVVGPIAIEYDGSYQSQFINEFGESPEDTFSEPFQGTFNLTLAVPNQEISAPLDLTVQTVSE